MARCGLLRNRVESWYSLHPRDAVVIVRDAMELSPPDCGGAGEYLRVKFGFGRRGINDQFLTYENL